MRGAVSAKLLNLLQKHDLRIIRRAEAAILYDLAAVSFGMKGVKSPCETADPLKEYADFTVRCMEETVPDEDRLYAEAYRLGQRIRHVTGLTKREDLRRLTEYLYRNIDICLRWISEDKLAVRKCYFSAFYSPEQCRVMSNVDSGIIGGILGGGYVDFDERITEGCGRCRACHIKEKEGQR